jgi:ABC-type sugar transport system ATPase subunit
MPETQALLQMRHISKSFGVVQALRDVSFELNAGEVHALMGENGAGKSTLMNVLSGGLAYFDGEVLLDGKPVELHTPINAKRLGIAKIHQELQLVPYMTVAQNIFMGREKRKGAFLDDAAMNREAAGYLEELEIPVKPTTLIRDLRVGEQQMVEIAKALSLRSRILIMDEPTSAISKTETEHLFRVIRKLRAQGVGIIYITHRMEEVFVISDRLTVMRDGQVVDTVPTAGTTEDHVISMMVGRDIQNLYFKSESEPGDEVLRVEHLNYDPGAESLSRSLHDVSLSVRAGEVVGLAGLMGAGRSELCECLFGIHPNAVTGEVFLCGKPIRLHSPRDAIRHGVSFATEDRKGQGLVLQRSIGENMSLPLLKLFSRFGFMQTRREKVRWEEERERLTIKAPNCQTLAGALSGGNQQKVILGRWLLTSPKLLILDEPTRGIDVGAKAEIYQLIDELAHSGMAILVVSSEMPELIGLSDRIVALCEGHKTAEFKRGEVTQEQLLRAATRTEDTTHA